MNLAIWLLKMIVTAKLEIIMVLDKAKKPLTTKETTNEIIKRGKLKIRGATPQAAIIEEIKDNADSSVFTKTPKGFILDREKLKISKYYEILTL